MAFITLVVGVLLCQCLGAYTGFEVPIGEDNPTGMVAVAIYAIIYDIKKTL